MLPRKKIVIFDFNRTIYDTNRHHLMPGVLTVLPTLIDRGYKLYLITTARPSRRKLLRDIGLCPYFKRIIITQNKEKAFQGLIDKTSFDHEGSFVVGDRVREEIRYGGLAKMKTIWLKAGRFSKERPRCKIEVPTHTIKKLSMVLKLIK